jgi:hypothetical protein
MDLNVDEIRLKFHQRSIRLKALKRWAVRFNRPISGKVAYEIWHLLSSTRADYDLAKLIYRYLGYVPFNGYPLERS